MMVFPLMGSEQITRSGFYFFMMPFRSLVLIPKISCLSFAFRFSDL